MAEDLRIDSHKLIFHPQRVAEWMNGNDIYPICIEISPSGACNHRCVFCSYDYRDYESGLLSKEMIMPNLQQMADRGVKAIVLSGEGEPLLNKFTPELIGHIKNLSMDVAMSSNGALFAPEVAREILKSLSWVRFSVNAGNDEVHQRVHGSKPGDFTRIIDNIAQAVEIKKSNNYGCTIGVQFLQIPENYSSLTALAVLLRDVGVDYLTVKPYSHHPMSNNAIEIRYDNTIQYEDHLREVARGSYQLYYRSHAMDKLSQDKKYDKCLGLPFWTYIAANGDMYTCLRYIGNPDFCYGSLRDSSFIEIWKGSRRIEVLEKVSKMDLADCGDLCRLDEINAYLCQLNSPGAHVNFI